MKVMTLFIPLFMTCALGCATSENQSQVPRGPSSNQPKVPERDFWTRYNEWIERRRCDLEGIFTIYLSYPYDGGARGDEPLCKPDQP